MNYSDKDRDFMARAIAEARRGAELGEVPVGAVIVVGERVVAAAHNSPIGLKDPTAHAEILAIRSGSQLIGSARLDSASIYATLEPCVMCTGAIIVARIARLIFGAWDEKAGALGSVYDIGRDDRLNHQLEVGGGLMATESADLLREFFRSRRG